MHPRFIEDGPEMGGVEKGRPVRDWGFAHAHAMVGVVSKSCSETARSITTATSR